MDKDKEESNSEYSGLFIPSRAFKGICASVGCDPKKTPRFRIKGEGKEVGDNTESLTKSYRSP